MIQNSVYTKTLVARSELRAFQDKLKKDNPKELKMLAERIKKKWFHFPIYLWHDHDNYILDWHQRLKALDLLAAEWLTLEKDLVPVVYISAASLNEAKEIVAEANSKFSTMDQEFADLWFEWCDLDDLIIPDFDYLTDDEKEKEKKEDDVPDVTTPPIVQVGDIFVLGSHKIVCGDSTKAIDVAKLMWEQDADMVWTDPPYNVDYKWHANATKKGILNDKMDSDNFYNFLKDAFINIVQNTKQGGGIYFRHNHKEQANFERAIVDAWMDVKHQIVRNKPSLGLGGGDYRPKHELCFYCAIKGSKNIFYGDRTNATVVDLRKEKSDRQIMDMIKHARIAEAQWKTTIFTIRRDNVNDYVHPTQKPVQLCQLSIENNSKEWDIVLDLFLGSWVCLITAEKTNRRCYWMELDPHYVEVILKRYHEYTGGTKRIECINRDLDLSSLLWAK